MIQAFGRSIFFYALFFLYGNLLAAELPFSDVPITAPYYTSLKNLYEQGIISPTTDNLFRPDAPIDRDLYVSLTVGVGCYRCINPSPDDIRKYGENPFVDLTRKNRFFYCISYAKENRITQGYTPDRTGYATCENSEQYSSSPFCANNTISRIEALAILLRRANLWNDELNRNTVKTINIPDTSSYWYGYARKGIEAGLIRQKADGTIGQDEKITRAEFVMMADKVLVFNQCNIQNDYTNSFASAINILDTKKQNTFGPDMSSDEPIDLVALPEKSEIPEKDRRYDYAWVLTNGKTREVVKKSGAKVNGLILKEGIWFTTITVTDKATKKTSTSFAQILRRSTTIQKDTPSLGVIISLIADSSPPAGTKAFKSEISGGDGKYVYSWDFGDGTYSTESNPRHVYSGTGNYVVNLSVRDGTGKSSRAQMLLPSGATMKIPVSPIGVTISSPKNITLDEGTRSFITDVKGGNGKYSYTWDFGDGERSSLKNPTHTFSNTGKYIIHLNVQDELGNTSRAELTADMGSTKKSDDDILSEILILDPKSKAALSPKVSANQIIELSALPKGGDNKKYTYSWNILDEKTGKSVQKTGDTVRDLILAEGIWIVKLIMTDQVNKTSATALTKIISVNEPLSTLKTGELGNLATLITSIPLNAQIGDSIKFSSMASGGNGDYSYSWNFGDGTQSTLPDPSHSYDSPGTYTINLTARDSNGNIGTAQVVVSIGGEKDGDKDGVTDNEDLCPGVKGAARASGCPEITASPHRDNILNMMQFGTAMGKNTYEYSGLSSNKANVCVGRIGQTSGLMIGSTACQACPCKTSIVILSDLRRCDIIFPTILSPDKKDIYSRGKLYQIP